MRNNVQSVERSFKILRVVHRHMDGATIGEIASETELHTSTVSRLVRTLEQIGALKRVDGKLFVGQEIIELAENAPLTERLISIATSTLRDLAAETEEAVGLTLIEGNECYVFYQIPSSHHIQIRDWTGEHFPMHTTSTGKIYMAQLAPQEQVDFLNIPLPKVAPSTKIDWRDLEQEFPQIQSEGVAWTIDELEAGLTSVAAAIRNRDHFVAGLYISLPNYRVGEKKKLAQLVLNAANRISSQLGYEKASVT